MDITNEEDEEGDGERFEFFEENNPVKTGFYNKQTFNIDGSSISSKSHTSPSHS